MNATELKRVLADRGFDIPDVFEMDETQMANIKEWLEGERAFTIDAMKSDDDLGTWRSTYIPALDIFTTAQSELQTIIDSPLIELSAHGKELTTFRACEVWDYEVAVNLDATEQFKAFMKESIRNSWQLYQQQCALPLARVEWGIVGNPRITGVVQWIVDTESTSKNMDVNGLLQDYARWVGLIIKDEEVDNIGGMAPEEKSPRNYVTEFMEMCWQPEESAVREFLSIFYTQEEVDKFCEDIAWDNEAND